MTPRSHADEAKKTLSGLVPKLGARGVDVQDRVVKLTIVGTGFRRHPKVAATMFETLAKSRINIQMISTSDLRVSCVIDRRHGEKALRLLHGAFGLGKKRR
jgi:aspartate kinase